MYRSDSMYAYFEKENQYNHNRRWVFIGQPRYATRPKTTISEGLCPGAKAHTFEFLLLLLRWERDATCHIGAHVRGPETAAANACSQEAEQPF